MFLVMGITGKVGSATAEHLLAHGKEARALVCNREKASDAKSVRSPREGPVSALPRRCRVLRGTSVNRSHSGRSPSVATTGLLAPKRTRTVTPQIGWVGRKAAIPARCRRCAGAASERSPR